MRAGTVAVNFACWRKISVLGRYRFAFSVKMFLIGIRK